MKYFKPTLLFITALFINSSGYAQSRSGLSFGPKTIQEKQDRRYENLWSLSDWFEQQRRNRLMDQWLAINSSYNPFEFFIAADYTEYEALSETNNVLSNKKTYESYRGQLGSYASIIGLQALYMHSEEDFYQFEGSVHLRLLGRGIQNTNLTVFYGIRYKVLEEKSVNPVLEEKFRNAFVGGNLTLYATKYFGVEGLYKHYFEDESDKQNKLSGFRYEGTFFIDFSFIRPYATYFKEEEKLKTSTQETKHEREGIIGGIKIFF